MRATDAGANLDIINDDGKTALSLAQERNHPGIVELLTAAGKRGSITHREDMYLVIFFVNRMFSTSNKVFFCFLRCSKLKERLHCEFYMGRYSAVCTERSGMPRVHDIPGLPDLITDHCSVCNAYNCKCKKTRC